MISLPRFWGASNTTEEPSFATLNLALEREVIHPTKKRLLARQLVEGISRFAHSLKRTSARMNVYLTLYLVTIARRPHTVHTDKACPHDSAKGVTAFTNLSETTKEEHVAADGNG